MALSRSVGEREEILLNYATEKSMETAEIPLEEVTETKILNFKRFVGMGEAPRERNMRFGRHTAR